LMRWRFVLHNGVHFASIIKEAASHS